MKPHDVIEREVDALRLLKPKVRRYSAFGDDHHVAIDAAIEVLCKRMNEILVYALYGKNVAQHTFDTAMQACQWMRGGDYETAVTQNGWQLLQEGA